MGVNSFLIVLRSTGVVKMEILTCGVKWNRVGDEVFESGNGGSIEVEDKVEVLFFIFYFYFPKELFLYIYSLIIIHSSTVMMF